MATLLYLTPADRGRPLTPGEFERADGQEGFRYELIDGRLDVSPAPNFAREDLVRFLRLALEGYAGQRPEIIGRVYGPARVFVPGPTALSVPEPDLAVYRDFPAGRRRAELQWQDLTPVLVVEVLSEDNAAKDLERNRELYLQVPSVREYWIVDPRADPDRPTLTALRRRGRHWLRPVEVPAGGTYTTKLLPGFALPLDPNA